MASLKPVELMMSLDLPDALTFDDWTNIGRRLCGGARAMNWLIGDWLVAGLDRYGERAFDEANAIFATDKPRFGPIINTCRSFPEDRRHKALTFEHHLVVMDEGKAKAREDADQLLAEAERDGMTAGMLKAQVRIASDGQMTMMDDDPEDAAYRRIVRAWNLASRSSRQAFIESANDANMGVIDL